MKKLTFLLFAISFVAFISYAARQHSVVLNGTQTRGNSGSNASLKCVGVTISNTMKIIEINGENAGFWISNGSSTLQTYWKKNDPSAIGYQLNPGTYYVYPNLPANVNNASVSLVLK